MNLYSLASKLDNVDNIGQTFYLVDSDFRTAAQGWSQWDGTGPLDLYNQRNKNRVFYTPGGTTTATGTTDALAMQYAIDQLVDYRGDKLFLTPGSYSPATALTLDVPGMRLMGPAVRHPKQARVTVTAGVDAIYSLTAAATDVEIAHHRCIPITAKNFIDITAAAHRGYLHDLFYDATGIAASTSTEFVNGATCDDWLVERCAFYVDAAQGDAFTLASPNRWVWQDNDFMVGLTTVAWASVFTFTTSALGNVMRRNLFRGCGGATAAVFTNIVTGIANVNGQLMAYQNFVDGTALATASGFETTFGTQTDIEMAENFQSGDASGEGGVVIALA